MILATCLLNLYLMIYVVNSNSPVSDVLSLSWAQLDFPERVWQDRTYSVSVNLGVKNVGWDHMMPEQGEQVVEVLAYTSADVDWDPVKDTSISVVLSQGIVSSVSSIKDD